MRRLNVILVFYIFFVLNCLIVSINSQNFPNEQTLCPNNVLHRIGQTATCFQNGYTPVSCLDPIENGYIASIACQYGYQLRTNTAEVSVCKNGSWSRDPRPCRELTSCHSFDPIKPFFLNITDGTSVEIPWMASIEDNSKGIVCSGIILNAKLILSSAICLKQYDKEKLTVFVGQRNLDIKNLGFKEILQLTAQLSTVTEIYYNERYSMLSPFNYKTEIAIIEVERPFIYTPLIRPICRDWELFEAAKCTYCGNKAEYEYYKLLVYKCDDNTDKHKIFYDDELVSGFENCLNDIKEYPSDIFCPKTPLIRFESGRTNCTNIKGGGYFLKTKNFKDEDKFVLWGLLIETFTSQNPNNISDSGVVGTFVNLFNQKDFIQKYLDEFDTFKILQHSFTNRPCRYQELISTNFDILGCLYNNISVPCQQLLQTGSTVKVKCRFGYENLNSDFPDEFQCLNEAKWSNKLYKCQKSCGEIADPVRPQLVPLILGGKKTDIGDVPWHVSIFANNSYTNRGEYLQICGGTLINPNIVISAGHCFWDTSLDIVNDKKSYLVAAGKRYRSYNATESQRIQFAKIKEINIPKTYDGLLYRHDIAILVLEKSFTLNPYTKPACVDWLPYGFYDIEDNIKGRVAGWGSTSNEGESSNDLNSVEILTLTNAKCKSLVDPNYRDDITGEKFCAQGQLGETTCTGDSGGGFLVPKIEEDGVKRYYLWGVVSSGLNPVIHCTENFFSTYTNIQYHQDAIKALINENTV